MSCKTKITIGKNKYFSTKSVFGQFISLIDDSMISEAVKKHNSDRYVKHFKCQDHLLCMIFCCSEKCNSLRVVSDVMVGLSGKEHTVRINHLPKKALKPIQIRTGKSNFLKKFTMNC